MNREWLARERATARCVQVCFDEFVERRGRRDADSLLAICRLTWITGDRDNTNRVVAPALGELLRRELQSSTHGELQNELRSMRAPVRVRQAVGKEVGFTRFYYAYRSTSRDWMRRNAKRVLPILRNARHLRNDLEASKLYAEIQDLPRIPGGRGPMRAESLLTPTVACLDPRSRSPIINRRKTLRHQLKSLGLNNGTLVEQFKGLVGLIHQGGISDAFELDVSEAELPRLRKTPAWSVSKWRSTTGAGSRPLELKDAGEVHILMKAQSLRYHRRHDDMTNQLLSCSREAGLDCAEGTDPDCRYDARVVNYDGKGRDLLIEAKADTAIQFCRMAIGQLFDYRRRLPTRALTDLAVLFPARPSRDACDLLTGLGMRVLWFSSSMKRILGDVTF